jgi:hypothetical protein
MDTIEITVRPDRLNWPLRQVWVGELSSADFTVRKVPSFLDNVRIAIATPGTTNQDGEVYTCPGTMSADGTWHVYANPYVFPRAGVNLEYNVLADDENGNPRWLGSGILEVRTCPAGGSGTPPPVVPRDTYIRNLVTGKYHLLTASVDEDGNLTIDLATEGIDR